MKRFHWTNIHLAYLKSNLSFISEYCDVTVIDGVKVIPEELHQNGHVIDLWRAYRPENALRTLGVIHTNEDALRSDEAHLSVLEPYLNIVRLDVS